MGFSFLRRNLKNILQKSTSLRNIIKYFSFEFAIILQIIQHYFI